MESIPFYLHDLGQDELDQIARVFAGPILTTGEFVSEFERRFAEYLGVNHCVGVSSCTGGIHIVLLSLGIGPGDEVITTPLTFIATSTAILQAGAKPVFVDVQASTGNIDVANVEEAITPRTKAIVPVHLYGQMCDMKAIRAIADRHGLFVIEDAAHCIEGERDGVRPGMLSDAAVFSFFATKNLACGEGGAIVTNDPRRAEQLRLLRLHGMTKTSADRERDGYEHWDMVCMGWKYNMDNIQAAILLPQLQRVQTNWRHREELAQTYFRCLSKVHGVRWPKRLTGILHANHLFTIWVDPEIRDIVLRRLKELEIGVTVNYRAIHLLTFFRENFGYRSGVFPIAERIGASTITLPLYTKLRIEEIDHIVTAVEKSLKG
jgi:dTDP-4-amino-4,6-dideoxygalactose transaminase